MNKPFKMRGTPFQRNFGIGITESPDTETPFNDNPYASQKGGLKTDGELKILYDQHVKAEHPHSPVPMKDKSPFNIDLKTGISDWWNTNKAAWRDNVRKLGGAKEGMDAEGLKKSGQLGWGKIAAKSLAAGMRTLKGGYDAFQPDKTTEEETNINTQIKEIMKNFEDMPEEEKKKIIKENPEFEETYENLLDMFEDHWEQEENL